MAKGFRPTQLATLRTMNDLLRTMVSVWNAPPSTVWFDSGDGKGVHWHSPSARRKRADIPALEYPENNPYQLERLIKYMAAVVSQADIVAAAAQARLKEITGS